MQTALQITSEDVLHSGAIDTRIREKVVKLEKVCPRLSACRVMVTAPNRHPQYRKQFTVRLNIVFPGGEVVITRDHHEDVNVLLRDAFVAVRRELGRCVRRGSVVAGNPEPCDCAGF